MTRAINSDMRVWLHDLLEQLIQLFGMCHVLVLIVGAKNILPLRLWNQQDLIGSINRVDSIDKAQNTWTVWGSQKQNHQSSMSSLIFPKAFDIASLDSRLRGNDEVLQYRPFWVEPPRHLRQDASSTIFVSTITEENRHGRTVESQAQRSRSECEG